MMSYKMLITCTNIVHDATCHQIKALNEFSLIFDLSRSFFMRESKLPIFTKTYKAVFEKK